MLRQPHAALPRLRQTQDLRGRQARGRRDAGALPAQAPLSRLSYLLVILSAFRDLQEFISSTRPELRRLQRRLM